MELIVPRVKLLVLDDSSGLLIAFKVRLFPLLIMDNGCSSSSESILVLRESMLPTHAMMHFSQTPR